MAASTSPHYFLSADESTRRVDDDHHPTETSRQQKAVEKTVKARYDIAKAILQVYEGSDSSDQMETDKDKDKRAAEPIFNNPTFHRDSHISYLRKGLLNPLPSGVEHMDCSRSWMCYWIIHGLRILGVKLTSEDISRAVKTIDSFQDRRGGGFSGGLNGQIPHLAATYAAISALVSLESAEALTVIDKNSLYNFLLRLKRPDGSFIMHDGGGEADVRGVYCALSVASTCKILDDKLTHNCTKWILSCQSYEGGFSGFPGCEAHGGYTFCAVASLAILGTLDACNLKSLLRWTVMRQMSFEGGFSGRTNKLVDACYSYWVGGVVPIVQAHLMAKTRAANFSDSPNCSNSLNDTLPTDWLFNESALQGYLFFCCQENFGGFIDKPERRRDFYHTCYALSGISISQHHLREAECSDGNRVNPVHPVFNTVLDAVKFAQDFFQ